MLTPASMLGFSLAILIGFYLAVNNAHNSIVVMACYVCVAGLLLIINLQYRRLYCNR